MSLLMKQRVLQEIDLIPEKNLEEIYNFLHYFRLGLEQETSTNTEQIMAFAGSWQGLSQEMFDDLMTDVVTRRQTAFAGRLNRESIAN